MVPLDKTTVCCAFIEDWFVLPICENVSAEMSKGNESYFALTCHGLDVPWSCLHMTDKGELVRVYEHNADLQNLHIYCFIVNMTDSFIR